MNPSTLSDHLYSNDLAVRKRAAEVLRTTKSESVAHELLRSVGSWERKVSTRAAFGLTLISPELALPYLASGLEHQDPQIVEQSAWALGRVKHPRALELLVEALSHKREVVRHEAAKGLWAPAVHGFRSAAAIRALRKIEGTDKGGAALVLRHMLRERELPYDLSSGHTSGDAFDRAGGQWIR